MLSKRLTALLTLSLTVLGLPACGDDKKKRSTTTHDGGIHGDDDDDGTDEESSGGLRGLDGGILDVDRLGDGGVDASLRDAAPPVRCDLTHPELGCGIAKGDWVSFDRGVQVDTKTGSAWVAVELTDAELRNTDADDAIEKKCRALITPGLGKLRIPEIEDVRTWAAGCDKTEAAGSCPVKTDRAPASDADACRCDAAVAKGPHASGGFCRPEIPGCETLWVTTFCHPHSCTSHTHWFYDTNSGAVVLGDYKSEIAKRAKAYCVTDEPLVLLTR